MAQMLIAEDDVVTTLPPQGAVTRMGHAAVAGIASTAGAMAAVQAYRPDPVLLDVHLTGSRDCVSVGTDIQTLWSIPVICVSGSDLAQLAPQHFPEALWRYLTRPLDWGQLRDVLGHLFPGQDAPTQAVRRTARELRERPHGCGRTRTPCSGTTATSCSTTHHTATGRGAADEADSYGPVPRKPRHA
jgi:DNA-binding NtrC family response regulator